MGVTALSFSAVVNVPSGRLLGNNGVSTGPAVALTNTQVFAVLATGTPSATTYLRGDGTWSTISAGVSGSTGSTDNAVLRADGTGGATLQDSAFVIPDNATASPNATVNHASIQATGGTTNVSISIVPKGTGAFSLHVPDGTATGGNARGANAIDLCTTRSAADGVASGIRSVVIGAGRASGSNATAIQGGTASGESAFIVGLGQVSGAYASMISSGPNSTVNGTYAFGVARDGGLVSGTRAFGHGEVPGFGSGTVSGQNAVGFSGAQATADTSFAHGYYASATRYGEFAHANGAFAAFGDCQRVEFVLRNKTTTNSPVTLRLDGSSARLTIPSGKIMHVLAIVIGSKSDGSAVALYMRQVAVKNVGGTTSIIGTVNTLGTDTAAGTSLAITADDTNDALDIAPTGVASETWRWQVTVYGGELAFGT